MKIFFLTESLQWSGGAQQVLILARALTEKGHELTLGCQPGSEIMARAQKAGIPIVPVRMRQDYDVVAAKRVYDLLKAHPVDVLHAHHPTAHAVGLMAVAFHQKPVFAVSRRVVFRLRKNPFSRLKYRSSRIDGYVAISQAVRRELVGAGVDSERIEVIPTVMETSRASVEEGLSLRREFHIPEAAPLLIQVANFADFKGQDVLLEAFKRVHRCHPEAHVLFAGHGVEKLQKQVDENNLSSVVHLAGFRRDVPKLLAASTIFVMPSREEAAGTALREAMAVGLPAIGSRVGGIPESIEHEVTGQLFPVGDSAALADGLLRYLDQPAWAKTLAVQGQEWVLSQFSLPSALARTEAFYQKLMERRRSL